MLHCAVHYTCAATLGARCDTARRQQLPAECLRPPLRTAHTPRDEVAILAAKVQDSDLIVPALEDIHPS
jgi:hypothetical protein